MSTADGELARLARTPTLHTNGAKARYGVAYVRSILSQAKIGFTETSPDEDVLAIDGEIQFRPASVRVQIKCSSKRNIAGLSNTWPCKVQWQEKWNDCLVPAYLILVILDHDDENDWIYHNDGAGTDHRSAAFWTRVDTLEPTTSIVIPKSQRFTVETIPIWQDHLIASFTPRNQGLSA
jgi:hypothetical protein